MDEEIKPKIVISKCIEHDFCRYNAQIIRSEFIAKLKNYVEFIPTCPEFEIGLGIPRDPIRIISVNDKRKLVQPSTKKDVTEDMLNFINDFFSKLSEVDGFILKSQSPSCGIRDTKIFPTMEKSAPLMRSSGFFGKAVIDSYPHLAIEDEARLRNQIIRQHFLKKVYTLTRFRHTKNDMTINNLIDFHSKNKFQLMSYGQKHLKILGGIVSNQKKETIEKIFNDYQQNLYNAFSQAPRCTSNINVLNHAFGYVSGNLSSDEKKLYLESIENFRQGRIPLSVPTSILKSWIIRFKQDYLLKQTFFHPYPEELMEVEMTDACQARDYWK